MQSRIYLAVVLLSTLAIESLWANPATYSGCPPGVTIVNCFVDPCTVSSCPGDPTATCYSNYCGGCNAVWKRPDGTPAQCRVTNECPPGVPVVNCLIDPCSVSSCPADPTATCHSNYCGGCNAVWRRRNGALARCNRPPRCPLGQKVVNCLVDPCSVSSCPGDPTAKCTSNYCGGCNAIWKRSDGTAAQCIEKPKCPPSHPEVQCVRDPCQGQTCPTYRDAVCVANYCGGCFFDWFRPNGEKVTCDYSS